MTGNRDHPVTQSRDGVTSHPVTPHAFTYLLVRGGESRSHALSDSHTPSDWVTSLHRAGLRLGRGTPYTRTICPPWLVRSPRKAYARISRRPGEPPEQPQHDPICAPAALPDRSIGANAENSTMQSAVEKAAVLDQIADALADAIYADLQGNFESFGVFPTRKTP